MGKHTPGPWDWDEDGLIETPTGGAIASVAHHANINTTARTGEEFSSANARLIAAAPELLEAARMALEYIARCVEPSCDEGDELGDGTVHDGTTPEGNALRAAIARATGDPP